MSVWFNSIKWNISAKVVLLMLLYLSVLAIVTFRNAYHEIEEIFDAGLVHSAKIVLSLTEHEIEEHVAKQDTVDLKAIEEEIYHKYEKKIHTQIWHNNVIVYCSDDYFKTALPRQEGFEDSVVHGQRWRVFTLVHPSSSLTIEVGEYYDVRNELIEKVLWSLFCPLLILVPGLGLVVMWGVGHGFRVMQKISDAIEQRGSAQLDKVECADIPMELRGLVGALNRFMLRLKESLEGERLLSDGAAHEMRTPLAGIRAQAQVIQKELVDSDLRAQMEDLLKRVDELSVLLDRLLLLARINPEQQDVEMVRFDVTQLCYELAEQKKSFYANKNVNIDIHQEQSIWMMGSKHLWQVMLANVLDNAVKYSPAHGCVQVWISNDKNVLSVRIEDEGAGIPEHEHEKVFLRFYRLRQDVLGNGLGLAIVKKAADLCGVAIRLYAAPSGGLGVELSAHKSLME